VKEYFPNFGGEDAELAQVPAEPLLTPTFTSLAGPRAVPMPSSSHAPGRHWRSEVVEEQQRRNKQVPSARGNNDEPADRRHDQAVIDLTGEDTDSNM
jgi:hypothetical protein